MRFTYGKKINPALRNDVNNGLPAMTLKEGTADKIVIFKKYSFTGTC